MTWTTSDIPDLRGKVAVVTGANGGLGLQSARALAGARAHVVMAARNQDKARDAVEEIERSYPEGSLEIVELDLGSLASIESAADQLRSTHRAVDILMNNAGLMATPQDKTEDGFEMQFGVNHLGHWALTARLMPLILAADDARVVTVTSTVHHFGRRVDPANPHLEGNYEPWRAYGQSKLANYHFALGLQQEFESHGVRAASLVAHPGLSRTDLQVRADAGIETGGSRFWKAAAARTGMTAARGALSQLRAATDPVARGGEMYAPRYMQFGPPVRRPIMRRLGMRKSIETLWAVSERETGLALNIV